MSDVPEGAVVLVPGQARVIDIGSSTVLVHATGDDTLGAFSLLETGEPAPGSGPPLHVHRDAAESFYVIDGEYAMHLDGREFACPAGSFVHVPRGMAHTFRVTRAGSRKLNLYTPAAMVGYFDELRAAIAAGLDDTGLAEIAERYSMEVLGPAPEGYL